MVEWVLIFQLINTGIMLPGFVSQEQCVEAGKRFAQSRHAYNVRCVKIVRGGIFEGASQ